jgi:hypothetical protein
VWWWRGVGGQGAVEVGRGAERKWQCGV